MFMLFISCGVEFGSRNSRGASHIDITRPSQYEINRITPNTGLPLSNVIIVSSHTPENVNLVVKTRPRSIPHSIAANVLGKIFDHASLVCLLTCGRGKGASPSSRVAPIPAIAITIIDTKRLACPDSIPRSNFPHKPMIAPTNALAMAPATVYATTLINHRLLYPATFPRGVSAPTSDVPQRPTSCVQPYIMAAASRPNRGSKGSDTRPARSRSKEIANDMYLSLPMVLFALPERISLLVAASMLIIVSTL